MADIEKARRNVRRMVDGGASEQEIDGYLASQSLKASDLKPVKFTNPVENFMEPVRKAFDVKQQMKEGRGFDFLEAATSPITGLSNIVTKPLAQAAVKAGVPVYKTDLMSKTGVQQPQGNEAADTLSGQIQGALGTLMPSKTGVGLRGPQVPQAQIRKLTDVEQAIKRLTRRQNVADVVRRKNEFEAVGIEPTPLDVLDEASHGRVAAAAARQTPARQTVQTAVDTARRQFPDRMDAQVSRTIHADPRELEPVVKDLKKIRRATAEETYAGPYAEELSVPAEVVNALKSNSGRSAIDDAFGVAQERMGDPNVRGLETLQREMQQSTPTLRPNTSVKEVQSPVVDPLLNARSDPEYSSTTRLSRSQLPTNQDYFGVGSPRETPPIRASVLDRIQIAMRQKAENLMKGENANPSMAGAVSDRRKVINSYLDNVPGLGEARDVYRQQSRQIGAAEEAPNAFKLGSDTDITNAVQGLTPEQLEPSRQVLSQMLKNRLGQGIGSAPGVAERFEAPAVKRRIGQFAGDDRAEALAEASRLELERLRNLQQVSPRRFGAQSSIAEQDAVSEAAQAGGDMLAIGGAVMTGRPAAAVVSSLKLWARGLGMSDKEAELIATIAVDPAQTKNVLRALTTKYGPAKATKIVTQARIVAAQNAANMENQ
jgi:hypothetical protein